MLKGIRSFGGILWSAIGEFLGDGCPRMAAALSYYSIFAMPALLGLMALAASEFVDPGDVREAMSDQVQTVVGVESASQIVDVVEGVVSPEFTGPAALVGLVALIFGATGAFGELQGALNIAWGVQRDPRRSDVRNFLIKRGMALLMMVALGLLLLVSMVASASIAIVRSLLQDAAPASVQGMSLPVADLAISLVAVSILFTLILRYVPDAVVRWGDAAIGGLFTGVLFTAGKLLIGYYLARTEPGNVYGAAGSLAIALLWVYYSAIILLLGAEFTEVWACRHGDPIVPERGAVRVRKQVVYAEGRDEGREVEAGAT
jgi:membrane protein